MNAKGMIVSLDGLRKKIKAVSNAQIFSAALKGEMAAMSAEYFTSFRPAFLAAGASADELAEADRLFKSLHELFPQKPVEDEVRRRLQGRAEGIGGTRKRCAAEQQRRSRPSHLQE